MAFEPKKWADGGTGGTPITASELNRIERGIAELEMTPGPRGPKGNKGDNGFPTESQWEELLARVEVLEKSAE